MEIPEAPETKEQLARCLKIKWYQLTSFALCDNCLCLNRMTGECKAERDPVAMGAVDDRFKTWPPRKSLDRVCTAFIYSPKVK